MSLGLHSKPDVSIKIHDINSGYWLDVQAQGSSYSQDLTGLEGGLLTFTIAKLVTGGILYSKNPDFVEYFDHLQSTDEKSLQATNAFAYLNITAKCGGVLYMKFKKEKIGTIHSTLEDAATLYAATQLAKEPNNLTTLMNWEYEKTEQFIADYFDIKL